MACIDIYRMNQSTCPFCFRGVLSHLLGIVIISLKRKINEINTEKAVIISLKNKINEINTSFRRRKNEREQRT